MKQTLQLKTSQQLTLTPQLQQSIKLLQMSTLDLGSELERYLLENPLLEREDGTDSEDTPVYAPPPPGTDAPQSNTDNNDHHETKTEDPHRDDGDSLADWGSGNGSRHGDNDEEFDPILNTPIRPSLREHLAAQMGEIQLNQRERALMSLLIDELNDDGYLPTSLDDIAASLPLELEIDPGELECLRRLLTQFDPIGIGSRDLAEFLCLQLQQHPAAANVRQLASEMIRHHLPLLGSRDFTKLKKLLAVDEATLKTAHSLIASLRPRPSSGFDQGETHYVAPDILVIKRQQRWVARLNQGTLPKLRVNQMYASMLQKKDSEHNLGGQLQEARWLVKNIQQRFDTILRVADAIVERQQAFFEQGEVAMKPLILRDIADELGLHESTISRVTTQKYLLCSRGLFELKYFFGSSVDTDSGGECSATAIKALIRQILDSEDRNKPLSDGAIADKLTAQGIQVARRTIAKYREAMLIPPVSQRKAF